MPPQKDWPLYAIAQQLSFASKYRVRFAANVDVANVRQHSRSIFHLYPWSWVTMFVTYPSMHARIATSGVWSRWSGNQTNLHPTRPPSDSVTFRPILRSLQSTNIDSSPCLFLPRRSVNLLLFLSST